MSIATSLGEFFWTIVKWLGVALIFGSGIFWTLAAQASPDLLSDNNVRTLITLVVSGLLLVFALWVKRAQMFWKTAAVILTVAIILTIIRADDIAAVGVLFVMSFLTLLFVSLVMFDEVCVVIEGLCDVLVWMTMIPTRARANHQKSRTRKSSRTKPKGSRSLSFLKP